MVSSEMADRLTHAMVLAAGLGTRMRPITNTLPKPLVQVQGHAILDRNMDRLRDHGVRNIVVNGHHLMEQVEAHLAARAVREPEANFAFSPEPELLDQGGGIRQALPELGEGDFFLLNGDAFWKNDPGADALQSLVQMWKPEDMDFLLLLAPVERSTGYDGKGDFFLEDDGRLRFRDDAKAAPYIYTGAAVFSRGRMVQETERIFPLVPLFRQACAAGRLYGVPLAGHWFHIGTPPAIAEAEARMAELGFAD